ncbi:tubby C-terminal-like domain-containing protein [Bisporella sp. PMI_857]|nr:tubby C-terminal-like domain-containing protein [Bisporella sp. PMI_857]
MAQVNLPPVQPHLGINAAFCVPHQTVLKMQEKVWSLSGDTFHITDQAGVEVVQCRGTTLSLSDRKQFLDARGQPLFALRTKLLALHKTYYGETQDGTTLFTVKAKFSIGKAKMNATFTNLASDKKEIELCIRGDWFDKSAQITIGEGGPVVASINRSVLTAGQIFGGQQTYYVTVAPGVDLSLMAALCVCLDEKENEKK